MRRNGFGKLFCVVGRGVEEEADNEGDKHNHMSQVEPVEVIQVPPDCSPLDQGGLSGPWERVEDANGHDPQHDEA